jgi:RNA polymerase sigma-70 factor (ECF subfamily)
MSESARTQDGDLLERFRAGDRDSFTGIYRAHHRRVFRFVLFMTADEAKAGEVTQDVFVWLVHHPASFDPKRGALGDFLVGVARKLLKRRFSEEQRWLPLDDAAMSAPPANSDPGDTSRLREAIRALPERYRTIVVLCDLEEKTYEEAAVVMECPVGTVRSRLHRARVLLTRKLMGKGCPV